MKFFVILATLAAFVGAEAVDNTKANTLSQNLDISPDARQWSWNFETDNKIKVDVQGKINDADSDAPSQEQIGTVSYLAPNNEVVSWSFIAGPLGYQAKGDVIPTPPPTPVHVGKLLSYIATSKPFLALNQS